MSMDPAGKPIEIHSFDWAIHNEYAKTRYSLEQTQKFMDVARSPEIPPHTQVVDTIVKYPNIMSLVGLHVTHMPWAMFLPPRNFRRRRRSPFAAHCVAPELADTDEALEAIIAKIENCPCPTDVDRSEQKILMNLGDTIENLNRLLRHVKSRIAQFLQG